MYLLESQMKKFETHKPTVRFKTKSSLMYSESLREYGFSNNQL